MKPLKRKQILEIAEKLFNRFGIRRTGVDEIARLANVAKGTIYNYFGDKDGLFRELVRTKIQLFEEVLGKTLLNIKDPIEKVRVTFTEHLKITVDNPFLSDSLLYGSYEEKIKSLMEDLEEKTTQTFRKIIDVSYAKKLLPTEKRAIVNSLVFALKGMNETVRNRIEAVNIKKFENEIEYLVKALMPKTGTAVNGK